MCSTRLVLSWICFISLCEASAQACTRGRGRLARPAGFPWAELVKRGSCSPQKGSRGVPRAPGPARPAQLSPLPRSPSAQGLWSPSSRTKGFCSPQWILCGRWVGIVLLSGLKSGIFCPAWLEGLSVSRVGDHEAAHQVAKPKWKSNFFLCSWGQMWLFFLISLWFMKRMWTLRCKSQGFPQDLAQCPEQWPCFIPDPSQRQYPPVRVFS